MRRSIKPWPGVALASVVALALGTALSAGAPAARAMEPRSEGRPSMADVEVAAWEPWMQFFGPHETVTAGASTLLRDTMLHNCDSEYACVAAGEGDGDHTLFELTYCTPDDRWVSNFIGDGAVANHQIDDAKVVLKDKNKKTVRTIDAGKTERVDWDPIYYIDVC
jgi:hypothetical protein